MQRVRLDALVLADPTPEVPERVRVQATLTPIDGFAPPALYSCGTAMMPGPMVAVAQRLFHRHALRHASTLGLAVVETEVVNTLEEREVAT